jgi:hypothetical protein
VTRSIRPLILLVLLQALAACAATPANNGPTEYLDEKSAATVTVVRQPIVFARERRDLAANTRDYVTVAAAAVNRSGKITYVLIVYVWSTVDVRGAPRHTAADTLVLAADDRRLRFDLAGTRAADQGIAVPVHAPPGQDAPPNVYATDLATLRFIAAAGRVALRLGADDTAPTYELWDDERPALAAFVKFMNGDVGSSQ